MSFSFVLNLYVIDFNTGYGLLIEVAIREEVPIPIKADIEYHHLYFLETFS